MKGSSPASRLASSVARRIQPRGSPAWRRDEQCVLGAGQTEECAFARGRSAVLGDGTSRMVGLIVVERIAVLGETVDPHEVLAGAQMAGADKQPVARQEVEPQRADSQRRLAGQRRHFEADDGRRRRRPIGREPHHAPGAAFGDEDLEWPCRVRPRPHREARGIVEARRQSLDRVLR